MQDAGRGGHYNLNKAANDLLRGGNRSSGGGMRWVHRAALDSGAGGCKMSRLASLRLPLQVSGLSVVFTRLAVMSVCSSSGSRKA
jgi:hypothetical protein